MLHKAYLVHRRSFRREHLFDSSYDFLSSWALVATRAVNWPNWQPYAGIVVTDADGTVVFSVVLPGGVS